MHIDESQPVGETIVRLAASPGEDITYQSVGNTEQWRFFSVRISLTTYRYGGLYIIDSRTCIYFMNNFKTLFMINFEIN